MLHILFIAYTISDLLHNFSDFFSGRDDPFPFSCPRRLFNAAALGATKIIDIPRGERMISRPDSDRSPRGRRAASKTQRGKISRGRGDDRERKAVTDRSPEQRGGRRRVLCYWQSIRMYTAGANHPRLQPAWRQARRHRSPAAGGLKIPPTPDEEVVNVG